MQITSRFNQNNKKDIHVFFEFLATNHMLRGYNQQEISQTHRKGGVHIAEGMQTWKLGLGKRAGSVRSMGCGLAMEHIHGLLEKWVKKWRSIKESLLCVMLTWPCVSKLLPLPLQHSQTEKKIREGGRSSSGTVVGRSAAVPE
jgi:hypothetical protein